MGVVFGHVTVMWSENPYNFGHTIINVYSLSLSLSLSLPLSLYSLPVCLWCTSTYAQLQQLTCDLDGTHKQLESDADQFSLFQQKSCEQLEQLQSDVDALHSELKCHGKEKELLEQNCEQQRAELVRLRLAVSELELQKESLLFQSSSSDGTISSLKSQVWHIVCVCFF